MACYFLKKKKERETETDRQTDRGVIVFVFKVVNFTVPYLIIFY